MGLRQEDCEFETNLGHNLRPCVKTNKSHAPHFSCVVMRKKAARATKKRRVKNRPEGTFEPADSITTPIYGDFSIWLSENLLDVSYDLDNVGAED